MRERIVRIHREWGGAGSLRGIAAEVGVSPGTVSAVLKQAGVRPGKGRREVIPEAGEKPGSEGRPSLRDVAARAGVSLATASLALKESPKVLASTRRKVEAAAGALGYQPHPYISAQLAAVRQGRTAGVQAELGYLFSTISADFEWEDQLALPYGPARKFYAARSMARRYGYQLEPFVYPRTPGERKRLCQILDTRGIRGLVLDFPAMVPVANGFPFERFNCASFNEQTEFAPHVFSHNDFHNQLVIFSQLWLLGYRRIGMLMRESTSVSALFRRDAGFRHAQYHLVPEAERIPILQIENLFWHLQQRALTGKWPRLRHRADERIWLETLDYESVSDAEPDSPEWRADVNLFLLKHWLEQYRPEVVISEHDDDKPMIEKLGYRVPRDIGVAHSNLNSGLAGFSGIQQADEALAEAAVEEVVRAVELGRLGLPKVPLHARIPGQWVEGGTTRRIKKPSTPLSIAAERWIRRVMNQPVLAGGR